MHKVKKLFNKEIFEHKFKLKQNFAKSSELKRIENEYIIN